MLLFSNANSSSRDNGTIRYSCDDGATWSAGKQFKSGYMAYSTVTALSDGTFGLLYEGDGDNIVFAKFNTEWLSPFCGAQVTAAALSGANGATVQAQISVKNVGDTDLTGNTATFAPQAGWVFGSAAVPTVASGQTVTVTVPVTIPSYAKAGTFNLTAKVIHGEEAALGNVPVTITGGATTNIIGLDIKGSATDTARNLTTNPYAVGDKVPYQFVVNSLSNVNVKSVPTTGNFNPLVPADIGGPTNTGNCRFGVVTVWGGYTCGTPRHQVTAGELADGFFVPLTTWEATASGATTQNYTITGAEVDLVDRKPSVALSVTASSFEDKDGSGFASIGDVVNFAVTAKNDGNVALTGVSLPGTAGAAATLAVGASAVGTMKHVVSADDLAAGKVAAQSATAMAKNGAKDVVRTVAGAPFVLTLPTTPPITPPTTAPPTTTPGENQPAGAVSTGSVPAGAELTITARNLKPGTTATFTLHSDPVLLGTAVVAADGTATLTVKVPANVPAGAHTVVITGTDVHGQPAEMRVALTVAPAGSAVATSSATATTPSGPLANTGSNGALVGGIAVVLLLGGLVLFGVTRRRTVSH